MTIRSSRSRSGRFHARARAERFEKIQALVRSGGLGPDVEDRCRALEERDARDAREAADAFVSRLAAGGEVAAILGRVFQAHARRAS